ncbi:MAG TPA: hypothetical protein VGD99_15220 [Anaerolineae bacterium]
MLRGGAFNNTDNNVRAAVRNRNNPNNRNNNNGFRVVVAHIFLRDYPAGNITGWRTSLALALANAWSRH